MGSDMLEGNYDRTDTPPVNRSTNQITNQQQSDMGNYSIVGIPIII